MHGNIDKQLSKTRLGRGLDVCGPLLFDGETPRDGGPAASVEVQVVLVATVGGALLGVATPGMTFYDDGTEDQEWMVSVPHVPPHTFDAGQQARVTVIAGVLLVTGVPKVERWLEPVTIT